MSIPHAASTPEEQAEVLRACQGDTEAFDRLVARYYRRVYTLCLSLLEDPDEAEEATQEAFWRAYRNLKRYDPSRSFRTWLLSIAAHHAIDRLRRRRARAPWSEALPAETLTPEEHLLAQEERERIRRLVGQLPPLERALILLRYWEGASYREMAQALRLSESAVKSRLFRARRALAQAYRAELATLEEPSHA